MTVNAVPGAPGTVLMAHPSSELYGSDRMLLESACGLLESGVRVVVALPGPGPLAELLRERGAEVVWCRSPVLRKSAVTPRGFLRLVGSAFGGLGDAWKLVSRVHPGRVYVSTLTIPLWTVVARMRRIPVLCHVHEGESSAPSIVRAAIALPLLLADDLVANSRFSAEVLSHSFRSLGRRAEIVYNGVPGPPSRREARESLDSPLRVAYVGRLSPRKGVDVAIDAVGLLLRRGVPVQLDVVGTVFAGYEWYEQQLHEQVRELGLDDNVLFHGFVPSVWERVTGADVVVVPSRADEPFGNTAVEAILCGRPVIASATSGLLEATAGYRSARTAEPGDAGSLADALAELAGNWSYMRMGAWRDIALAEQRHSTEGYRRRIADEVLHLPVRAWSHAATVPALAGGRT